MILWNERIVHREEVRISLEDRGYNFGDGIYEVFRIYGGQLYEKEAHLNRLERSAGEIGLILSESVERIGHRLDSLVEMNGIREGTLYLQITRGEAPRAFPYPSHATPVLTAFCKALPRPVETMRNGISALLLPDLRWLRCDIKSLNLLGASMAKQQALEHGADESILHRNGIVTEGSSCNVMAVKEGILYTHPADNLILHGITRMVVLRLARLAEIPVREAVFTTDWLTEAEEIFITSTTAEITPVIKLNGRTVGSGNPGPVTRKLQNGFEATLPG